MDAFVTAVLFKIASLNATDPETQAQLPPREFAQAEQGIGTVVIGDGEWITVLSVTQ